MLSLFSDVMKVATRQERWSPPDYWNNQRAPRSNAQREREEAVGVPSHTGTPSN